MSAVETMDTPASGGLVPVGVPVVSGRVHLGRLRSHLPADRPIAVVVGFGSLVWLGALDEAAPDLGRMVYRSVVRADHRGRVVLNRQARAWLALPDPASFEALVMPATRVGQVGWRVRAGGSRPASSQPATAAVTGSPTRTTARLTTGTRPSGARSSRYLATSAV